MRDDLKRGRFDPCFRLRQIDRELMLRLQNKVNIVPVIAKADTLTRQEVLRFKATVSNIATTS